MKSVSILGSTGSIGRSTIDLLEQGADLLDGGAGAIGVEALAGGRNVALLASQARRLGARFAAIADPALGAELRERLAGTSCETGAGPEAINEAAARPADWTMAAITGAVGLTPTLEAVRRGGTVALANKEALVSAGDVMLDAVRRDGAVLLPVDSEHNAIFQALGARMASDRDGARAGPDMTGVDRITLTASGGPFRTASLETMAAATPEIALRHPTWSMGAKISIDSATMFNKGLEIIEAARLFGLAEDRIGVLVHPQSLVHGLVRFVDGSVVAQLGPADMRVPIAHCLAWPERLATNAAVLDLARVGTLDFAEPDPVRFPGLRLAREALRAGRGVPTILNAANEVAVAAFLAGRIGFLDIARVVETVMGRMGAPEAGTLDSVFSLDAEARRQAEDAMRARAA